MDFREVARQNMNAERLASAYLRYHFKDQKPTFPINPFEMLNGEGILFKLSNFDRLEGVYIPENEKGDTPLVAINANRPITRQRYTAAHELCHHFKDYDKQISCPIGNAKDRIERFANSFAAALLMPLPELNKLVEEAADERGFVSFEDVLDIAFYFGVSFQACLFRIAYKLHAIDGDTSPTALSERCAQFKPDKIRKAKHLSYTPLYEGLIDNYAEQLKLQVPDHAKFIFLNNYIYNDSRMENVDVSEIQASEIVTDLRLNTQKSKYCNENNEAFMSIAGHYRMYKIIFDNRDKDSITIFDLFKLNNILFSCYPDPSYGGSTRQNNTLVLGAKFETVDHTLIMSALLKLEDEVESYFAKRNDIPLSDYIEHVARIHHQITVIHPFNDGNGRTSRAFMNTQLVRAGLTPIYIKLKDKPEYLRALERADKTGDYADLYEVIFKALIQAHVDLNQYS